MDNDDAVSAMSGHEPSRISQRISYDASRGFKNYSSNTAAKVEPIKPASQDAELRYKKRTAYLLLLYIPLLIIPWIFTCILDVRPLNQPSYINQRGQFHPRDLDNIRASFDAARVLNSIAAVATIPVISTLLGQAAVVFTQRRNAQQALNVQQLFALADKGWSDYVLLGKVAFSSIGAKAGTSFLWLAAGIVLIASIQQPLQTLLVKDQSILVVTCKDSPEYFFYHNCSYELAPPAMVGYDPEPAILAVMPSNLMQTLYEKSLTVSLQDAQPNIWPGLSAQADAAVSSYLAGTLGAYIVDDEDDTLPMLVNDFYVSSISNTVLTGVLREHALRLNSSVDCTAIPHEQFPSDCSGSSPFTTRYSESHPIGEFDAISYSQLEIQICVPGNSQVSPWTLSRNQQDISEDLFIDVILYPSGSGAIETNMNFTTHCTVSTTRGYFELGNHLNNYTPGPLLPMWPSQSELLTEYNDYAETVDGPPPTATASGISNFEIFDNPTPVPAPLMMAATALFGGHSFFGDAVNLSSSDDLAVRTLLCNTSSTPLANLDITTGTGYAHNRLYISSIQDSVTTYCDDKFSFYNGNATIQRQLMDQFLYEWFLGFNESANAYLSSMLFLTHQTLLTQPVLYEKYAEDSAISGVIRIIYSSPGETIIKPHKSLASTIIISLLILLQLLAIALLVAYIYHMPTWTPTLNALAVARIGAYLERKHRPRGLSAVKEEDEDMMEELATLDGLIGVEEDIEMGEGAEGSYGHKPQWSGIGACGTDGTVRLGVGAKGLVLKRHARKRLREVFRSSKQRAKRDKSLALRDGESGMPLRGD